MVQTQRNGLTEAPERFSRFVVTMDTDWAPQFVLDHALEMLAEYGLGGTVFCTGRYSIPTDRGIEAALHPNFMPDSTQGSSAQEILSLLKGMWPDAVGCRSHRLFWHSGLREVLKAHGLLYDCSALLPLQPLDRPADSGGLKHLSIWWSDNQHMIHDFALNGFDVPGRDAAGVKVLLFHPLLIYLNVGSREEYLKSVAGLPPLGDVTPKDLERHRRAGPGVESLFRAALRHVADTQGQGPTLERIVVDD